MANVNRERAIAYAELLEGEDNVRTTVDVLLDIVLRGKKFNVADMRDDRWMQVTYPSDPVFRKVYAYARDHQDEFTIIHPMNIFRS